jgi:predicted methyltransferase
MFRSGMLRAAAVAALAAGVALVAAAPARAQQGLSLSERAELSRILDRLGVQDGAVVADVGAGSGLWTIGLARAVGASGRVYATEVRRELVAGLRVLVGHGGLRNVIVVKGSQDDMGLPPGCCDAALLRIVYSSFQNSRAMRGSLSAAVRPGGRVLIVDFKPSAAELQADMLASGFDLVDTAQNWTGQQGLYASVFQKR